jgi:hypothetical protein
MPDRPGGDGWLAVEAAAAGLAFGSLLEWASTALVGSFRPLDLADPYWSGVPWLRTDTSGFAAFIVAAVCLLTSEYLRLRRRRSAASVGAVPQAASAGGVPPTAPGAVPPVASAGAAPPTAPGAVPQAASAGGVPPTAPGAVPPVASAGAAPPTAPGGAVLLAMAAAETVAVLATGLFGYLSVNAVTHHYTLQIQATHLLSWPTEGTLRVVALLLCIVSFGMVRYLRPRIVARR